MSQHDVIPIVPECLLCASREQALHEAERVNREYRDAFDTLHEQINALEQQLAAVTEKAKEIEDHNVDLQDAIEYGTFHLSQMDEENGKLQAHTQALQAALENIRNNEGKVCETFEICTHRACRSSFASREIADRALTPEEKL